MGKATIVSMLAALALFGGAGGPNRLPVKNGGFEADTYAKHPGYASQNGGITGWTYEGNAGVNPWWHDPELKERPQYPFHDNGRTPQGRQVALMQNKCTLSQRIAGFQAGKRYRVTYFENARHNRQPDKNPRLMVTLGGEIVVSEHTIKPVNGFQERTLPFNFVESAEFAPSEDGVYELVFITTTETGVTALIDKVEIVEVSHK